MKKIILFLFFVIPMHFVSAQALEVGLGAGAGFYRGDLNPNFNPLLARPGVNAMVRYNFSRAFSVRASTLFTKIAGNDALSSNPLNKERNWRFSGILQEWNLNLEFNFLNFRSYGTIVKSDWTPIIFLGLGQFRIPSRSYEANNLIRSYNIDSPNLALIYGFGFKKKISNKFNLSGTFGCRLPFDKRYYDDLDGFGYKSDGSFNNNYPDSATQDAKLLTPNTTTRDNYYYASFTFSYVFEGIKCPAPRR